MEKIQKFAEEQNTRIWSSYQKNIFEHLKFTNKNIVVSAAPGSGKTTTLIECLNLIPKMKKTIFLSFSKLISEEIKTRVDPSIRVSTLHSLGMFYLMRSFGNKLKLNDNKYFQLALTKGTKKDKDPIKLAFSVQDIVRMSRLTLTRFESEKLVEMCDKFEINYTEKSIEKAIDILENIDPYMAHNIDFTDMLYFPVIRPQFIFEKFDYILVDEAQDLNACQIRFIERLMHEKTRLISVGDGRQSIFGFAGSDIASFEKLMARENTITLPLSISYRCGKQIVMEAQKIYPDVEFFDKSPNGIVRRGEKEEIVEGDFVLCRKNVPLLKMFFFLIEREIKANIVGKDIEDGLNKFVRGFVKKDVPSFLDELEEALFAVECELLNKGIAKFEKHPKYIALDEKVSLLHIILQKINNINLLEKTILGIFDNDTKGVKLMTFHKSKGLENDRVFILENFEGKEMMPTDKKTGKLVTTDKIKQEWQLVQENNLKYVGITRAKKELVYFDY